MTRTSRTQRLVMLAASTVLAAGGALRPSNAFFVLAPATPRPAPSGRQRCCAEVLTRPAPLRRYRQRSHDSAVIQRIWTRIRLPKIGRHHDTSGRTRRGAAPRSVDVARLAGVSQKTVSRVMNDEPYVSADVRRRVLAAAEELGYRSNNAARALASGRTRSIG